MVYVFLANGFEEMEALAPVDLLRRAGLEVQTVGIGSRCPVGAHGVPVTADITAEDMELSLMTVLVLPGGMPGTTHLDASETVKKAIAYAAEHRLPMGAICAAPSVLGHAGVLQGRRATCYPGFEPELTGAVTTDESVVTDGLVTTARGAGVATEFALELVARLVSPEAAEQIRRGIQCP